MSKTLEEQNLDHWKKCRLIALVNNIALYCFIAGTIARVVYIIVDCILCERDNHGSVDVCFESCKKHDLKPPTTRKQSRKEKTYVIIWGILVFGMIIKNNGLRTPHKPGLKMLRGWLQLHGGFLVWIFIVFFILGILNVWLYGSYFDVIIGPILFGIIVAEMIYVYKFYKEERLLTAILSQNNIESQVADVQLKQLSDQNVSAL